MGLIQSSTWRPKYLLVVHNAAPTTEGTSGHIISSVLVAAALAGLCVQLAVLPLWLLPADPAWVWLLVPMALLTTPFWSLIHEAIHGVLLRERVWNDRFGRTLAIGDGAPFVLLKAAHLLHHRYSRTRRERTEIYDPATSSWAAAAPGYYLRLLGGVYLAEVASVLLVASPRRLWRYLARRLDSPDMFAGMLLEGISRRHFREFRADGTAVILVYAAAGFAYGRHVWIWPPRSPPARCSSRSRTTPTTTAPG